MTSAYKHSHCNLQHTWIDLRAQANTVSIIYTTYAAKDEIYLGSTQDGKAAAPHTAVDGDHPVVQIQTLLAPGQSTTFRVTFLGSAKQAKAAVTAVSTPTITQSAVQPAAVDCGKPAG